MGGILDLIPPQNLYEEDEEEAAPFSTTLSSSLGLNLPNPAPEIDMEAKNNPGKFLHSIDFMIKCFKNLSYQTLFNIKNSHNRTLLLICQSV